MKSLRVEGDVEHMRVNVLQHTPNEGVGYIGEWAKESGHEVYIYHPYMNDGVLPLAEETDMLVILRANESGR